MIFIIMTLEGTNPDQNVLKDSKVAHFQTHKTFVCVKKKKDIYNET